MTQRRTSSRELVWHTACGRATAIRASFGIFFDNWAGVTQIARNHEGTWPSTGARFERNQNLPTPEHPTPVLTGQIR